MVVDKVQLMILPTKEVVVEVVVQVVPEAQDITMHHNQQVLGGEELEEKERHLPLHMDQLIQNFMHVEAVAEDHTVVVKVEIF